MPIEPSVFHEIKTSDVQQQPIYAYKHFKVTHVGFDTASGYHRHDGQFSPVPPPLGAQQHIYPEVLNVTGDESDFQGRRRNKATIWQGIDARFYRFPYDPGNTMELSDRRTAVKFLSVSCSVLTAPYFEVGERIKKGSVSCSFMRTSSYSWAVQDDTYGNLRDPRVFTSSMATSSRNILYMSFNEVYRDVKDGLQFEVSQLGGDVLPPKINNISYAMGSDDQFSRFYDTINENVKLMVGVTPDEHPHPIGRRPGSGYAANFANTSSFIRIPNNDVFNRFNCCDDWTIAFWYCRGSQADFDKVTKTPILSKGGIVQEEFFDTITHFEKRPIKGVRVHEHPHPGSQKANRKKGEGSTGLKTRSPRIELLKKTTKRKLFRDKNVPMPDIDQDFKEIRTPFNIGIENEGGYTRVHFQASDGKSALHISSSTIDDHNLLVFPNNGDVYSFAGNANADKAWMHVAVRNLQNTASIFINGVQGGTTGSIPSLPTQNKSDLMFGRYNTFNAEFAPISVDRKGLRLQKGFFQTEGNMQVDGPLVLFADCQLSIKGDLNIGAFGSLIMQPHSRLIVYGNFSSAGTLDLQLGSELEIVNYDYAEDNFGLAEFRMYDYGLNQENITSLADRDYRTGSLYQTNVVGNVFYRNHQFVISSPMPMYRSGSGAFFHDFDVRYRGTHKIYENNVLVRVPKDLCNVSMNPTATYQIPTVGDSCKTNQRDVLPGEFRKHMFVSGTAFPYITTIGLYDNDCRLLAVGKMAQPIQKRSDIDMNFIVRWDY